MPSTYTVEPTNGVWSLSLDGQKKGNFPTMQEAIETAKAKAAREGRFVRWRDGQGEMHGPVKPSSKGWYSPGALMQRLGLSRRPMPTAGEKAPESTGQ
jgi:hypothetical protein